MDCFTISTFCNKSILFPDFLHGADRLRYGREWRRVERDHEYPCEKRETNPIWISLNVKLLRQKTDRFRRSLL